MTSPRYLAYNSTNNTIYVGGYNDCVVAIDGATNQKTARIPTGSSVSALCYNPTNNKVYCANYGSGSVTVVDGATNGVIATVPVGGHPYALCYSPTSINVYCVNNGSASVTAIDGATNEVTATVPVGRYPTDFCLNPAQNRVYVANYYSSSISVLRDSARGIEESFKPQAANSKPRPTIVRRVMWFDQAKGEGRMAKGDLLDISGRKVLDLRTGANDVRALVPGVYFIRRQETGDEGPDADVRKVVVTR